MGFFTSTDDLSATAGPLHTIGLDAIVAFDLRVQAPSTFASAN